jgi:hypothetical protein
VFLGPVLIHYRKIFVTNLFFASSLIGLSPQLQGVRALAQMGKKHFVMLLRMSWDLLSDCHVSFTSEET